MRSQGLMIEQPGAGGDMRSRDVSTRSDVTDDDVISCYDVMLASCGDRRCSDYTVLISLFVRALFCLSTGTSNAFSESRR